MTAPPPKRRRAPGAGRPPIPHGPAESHNVTLSPAVWRWLALCATRPRGVSAAIESVIRAHPLFQTWLAGEPPDDR